MAPVICEKMTSFWYLNVYILLLGPSPSTSAFDRLGSSFCDAFDHALMDMKFHQFVKLVIACLNKDIRREVIAPEYY